MDGLNIPANLGKSLEIIIKDTSGDTRRFLVDMLLRLDVLEKRVATLEGKNANQGNS